MSQTFSELFNILSVYDDVAYYAYGNARTYKGYAQSRYNSGNDHAALGYLLTAVGYTLDCIYSKSIFSFHAYNSYTCCDIAALKACYDEAVGEPFELTWTKIITAYLDAKDDERSAWQLLTDAYQASMYDKPFDLEYHTMWIQRFKSWA